MKNAILNSKYCISIANKINSFAPDGAVILKYVFKLII